ncbi:MFS transporter [Streptomyces galbus]|uniref:MFS transporter n=1 Tax=Streptomyces galbus TaxID=33898 RepID=A0A4U5X8F4_STRGB|nr:MFS transporter [Streptomyces galbus]
MELEKRSQGPSGRRPGGAGAPEGCLVVAIRMPVRIVALVLVVPVRMAWDALAAAGRFLYRTVGRPVGRALVWLARAVCVWPFVALWRWVLVPAGRGLAWLARMLVVVPARWAQRYLLAPLGRGLVWLYARVLTPLGQGGWWLLRSGGAVLAAVGTGLWAGAVWLGRHLVVVPVRWLLRYLVAVPALWLYARVLTPAGRALASCARGVARLVGVVLTGGAAALLWSGRVLLVAPAAALRRWVLVPVGRVLGVVGRELGQALGHAWRVAGYVSPAVGRFLAALFRWVVVEPVRWVYRAVLTPVGHVVRDAVLRPAAQAVRGAGRAARQALAAARETVRQARADVRRALFGELPQRDAPASREPRRPAGRTLDGSTTALTHLTKD